MDLGAYFRVIRPSGCILVAASTFIGQVLALGNFPEPSIAITAGLSCFLLTASSFTLNDYVDYEVDFINTPQRPIPSGRMTRNEALRYGIILGIVGLVTTILLNPVAVIVGLTVYALTIFYTLKVKVYGFIGNIIVAFSIASYFLFGYLTISNYINPKIIGILVICFFYVLGGEVAQSIADAEGDKLRGVKSISLVRGPMVAALVTSLCYLLMAVMGAYTALLFGIRNNRYSLAVVIGTILIFGFITLPLLRKPNKETAIRTRNRINAVAFLIVSGIFVLLVTYFF
jgi:geranylgeranylglycerol-phosphate geranylgeranyltransferase